MIKFMRRQLLTSLFSLAYLAPMMGHLHESPQKESPGLSTLACGHPVEVLQEGQGWSKVKASGMIGHIESRFLISKRPNCFQAKYSQFFQGLNLDLSNLYYWGRLSDRYEQIQTFPR